MSQRYWWFIFFAIALILVGIFYRQLGFLGLWLKVESPWLVRELLVSLLRFGKALLYSGIIGVGIGLLLKSHQDIEGFLTPWVLSALALPWIAVIIILNLMAGLSETAALWISVAAAAPHIIYAMRPLSSARSLAKGFLQAYRILFIAIATAEILGANSGIGSQIRFFFLFWNPARLIAYSAILLLLYLTVEGLTRATSALIQTLSSRRSLASQH